MISPALRLLFALSALSLLCSCARDTEKGTTLRWAHIYEPEHPFHLNALWAAEQIRKRTQGRVDLQVFPSSALGKEVDINEGISIGSVDIIYSGAAFSEQLFGPISMSNYPYMIRDYAHWQNYRDSELFEEIKAGYENASGNTLAAITYYGQRHVTSNKPITAPADMQDLIIRVPNSPLYMLFPRATGANPAPIAFSEVYLALQQGVVDAQENPLPIIRFNRFYEVQSHINLTGHITITSLTLVSPTTAGKIGAEDYQHVLTALQEASYRASDEIYQSEQELGAWFEERGITVNPVDKSAFQDAVEPVLSRPGMPFTPAQMQRLKALQEES